MINVENKIMYKIWAAYDVIEKNDYSFGKKWICQRYYLYNVINSSFKQFI